MTYIGQTFRVIAWKLRVQRGPGRGDKNVERPRMPKRGPYLDSDDKPTLLTIDEHDQVNVPALLASGAIIPWSSKTVVSKSSRKGAE
jgi:hypothetical protein